MALDSDQILVAGTGKILIAPVGTAAPADTATAWGAGWVDLGYTTEDGVVLRPGRTVTDIPAWQSTVPVRRLRTSETLGVVFTLLQLTQEALLLALNGGTFTPGTGITTYTPGEAGTIYERAVGVEGVDGTRIIRAIVARADVSDIGDIPLTSNGAMQVPVTMGMLMPATGDRLTIIADDDAIEAAA